ncbi:uncharacterized protein PHACADRAFT_163069 [Phanerochaete carnosa HHB-10118-sp]|uniref:Malate dehydrogenase n=1 Tax=Phanerochaete carnosa (strain HHB-10118-sp) TaxID=650164 RepID=K5UX54_PHACS|nr:uncharacterized protein PHACADRAFT_163069 [Phanerochaete carnosa HHB-10118-sp]EKM54671.1 hypothetical protein PHACADRAFT_163069 [Phanerochaete carnosa HHB-10118-sp]
MPLVPPPPGPPSFFGLGVGTQNYTCASTGTYSSIGAVAEIFDISCLPEPTFDLITDIAYDAWKAAPESITALSLINTISELSPGVVLGQHFFIDNPTGSGLSPEWDFTSASEAGNPNAFVVGATTGSVPAPSNPTVNINWLSLKSVEGELATAIYRVSTQGGQPPASCTPGSANITVRYTAQYVFYGSSL